MYYPQAVCGWGNARAIVDPLMRMVQCGKALQLLLEPLLLTAVGENVSNHIWKQVPTAMNIKRTFAKRILTI